MDNRVLLQLREILDEYKPYEMIETADGFRITYPQTTSRGTLKWLMNEIYRKVPGVSGFRWDENSSDKTFEIGIDRNN